MRIKNSEYVTVTQFNIINRVYPKRYWKNFTSLSQNDYTGKFIWCKIYTQPDYFELS